LFVTDGTGSFELADFGLTTLISLLEQPARPYMRVSVTTAHRDDGTADLPRFRFAPGSLVDNYGRLAYDEVWLFGVQRPDAESRMSAAEVAEVAAFMNAGGGVLAAGDHESMGYALCGTLPRVRTMRSWWFPTDVDIEDDPYGLSNDGFAQPVAPSFGGTGRHDTLVMSPDDVLTFYHFDDQSDGIPQTITPTYFRINKYLPPVLPHPLLCTPNGVITVLPDHPHEGDCHVPNVTTAGLLTPAPPPAGSDPHASEYPTVRGHQELPVVVATSWIEPHHWTEPPPFDGSPNKPPTFGGRFGANAAYDGHRVDVGRVAVEASWHHFFDINLIGATTTKTGVLGPDPLNAPRNPQIIEYYRNLATWLAPAYAQRALAVGSVLVVMRTAPLNEEIRPGPLSPGFRAYIGSVAYDAMTAQAGPCTVQLWVWSLFGQAQLTRSWPIPAGPAPWFESTSTAVDPVLVSRYLLGHLIAEMIDSLGRRPVLEAAVKVLPELLGRAVPAALAAYVGDRLPLYDKLHGDMQKFARAINEVQASS
jgi:hypothetical protein